MYALPGRMDISRDSGQDAPERNKGSENVRELELWRLKKRPGWLRLLAPNLK
jgi:hypothetical protein